MAPYKLFISHSWTYADAYERLIDLLNGAAGFSYKIYAVARDDPVHGALDQDRLYEAIRKQIARSQVVVLLAGVDASYDKWTDKEIEIAKREFAAQRPIIAIEAWDPDKTSQAVRCNADRLVTWNADSVVLAIKELAK
ncbi:MAG TPA: TIR domain-containing protein [Syntrophorhabdaceae bacterium]|nr:TIR domain-containing protein [Syntrophorhabdaceae bacterium]